MIDPILVQSLQLLKDIRRLRFPLLIGSLDIGCDIGHLVRRYLARVELGRLFVCTVHFFRNGSEIALDCTDSLHLPISGLIIPQWALHIDFDLVRQYVV